MHELGLTKTVFFSDDGTQDADYISLSGKDGEGQYASSTVPGKDDAAFKAEFEKTFSVKYDDYGPYQPGGYDAAQMILNAIKAVAKTDASGNLTVDREALIKAIRTTTNYVGLTRTLTCNSVGECGTGTVIVYQVKSGAWVPVKTYTSDDLKALAPTSSATMAATMAGTMAMSRPRWPPPCPARWRRRCLAQWWGQWRPTMAGTMAPTMAGTMVGTMSPTMAGTMSPTMAATK